MDVPKGIGPDDTNRPQRIEDVTITDPKVINRAVTAAALGNITEWYDFGVYAYLAITIEGVFFSDLPDPWGTITTFGLFAVSFLVRPFGGMFFGPLSDRIGRTKVLSATVILMALGTFCIGLIPSTETIGLAGPMLLLLCRLVQGFSTGGEYGSAMTFIAEYAADRKRGFLGSWLEFGTLTGYLMGATFASILGATLSDAAMTSWGWRLPFFLALPLGIAGLYLRWKLEETPAFASLLDEAEERDKERVQEGTVKEIGTILTKHWRAFLTCGSLVIAWNVTNYMLTTYIPTYLTADLPKIGHEGLPTSVSDMLQIGVLAIGLVAVTFLGRLSDRFGRRTVIGIGCGALILLSLPSVLLIRTASVGTTFIGLAIMALTLVCFSSTGPSTLPALFPTEVRAGGLSISFNITISIFCGTVPTVMSALVGFTKDLNWPAYYLIGAGVIGVVGLLFTRESANRALPGSPPAVNTEKEARELIAA